MTKITASCTVTRTTTTTTYYLLLNINLLCPFHNFDLHLFFLNLLFCYRGLKIVSQF